MGIGNVDTREEGVAVVDARHDETEDQFDSTFDREGTWAEGRQLGAWDLENKRIGGRA